MSPVRQVMPSVEVGIKVIGELACSRSNRVGSISCFFLQSRVGGVVLTGRVYYPNDPQTISTDRDSALIMMVHREEKKS